MPYDIHYISVKDFIRTRNTGVVDLETSKKNLINLCNIWREHSDQNVLVDLRHTTIDFSVKDIQEYVEVVLATGLGQRNRVALLYKHRDSFDRVRFFEFLAVQKGLGVKACEDFEEAIEWLSELTPLAHHSVMSLETSTEI
jgi:hypothetical protein